MALNNPYNAHHQYKQNKILMASPQELTLMLYEGAIKFANQAILAIEAKDVPKSHELIMRTSDIITELNVTLNMDYEVSKGLRPIYDFILNRLMEANITKNKEVLQEVIPFLNELRDTWKEAMALAKKA